MLYIGRFESWEWAIGYIPENRQHFFTKSAEPTRLSPNSRAQSLELKELIQYGVRSVLLFYNRFGPNPENDRLQPCDLLVHLDKALSDVGVPAAPPSASCSRLISADSHRFINFRLVSSDFPSHPIDTILFFSCLHPLVWIPICSFAFLIPQLMRINSWTWMSRQVFTPEPPWLSQNTFWLRLHLSLCHPGNQQLLEGGASGINAVRSPKAITARGLSQRPTFRASPAALNRKSWASGVASPVFHVLWFPVQFGKQESPAGGEGDPFPTSLFSTHDPHLFLPVPGPLTTLGGLTP